MRYRGICWRITDEERYNPTSGTIHIDGHAIDSLNLRWLRNTISLVQQEPVLFVGTVFENVRYGLVGTPGTYLIRLLQMIYLIKQC